MDGEPTSAPAGVRSDCKAVEASPISASAAGNIDEEAQLSSVLRNQQRTRRPIQKIDSIDAILMERIGDGATVNGRSRVV
jgi:hypothetical protein